MSDFQQRLGESLARHLPGFENSKMLGAAEQMGIRQTRLLQGEYVVNKDDVKSRRYFKDTVCRGRDYYTPYRALLPRGIDNLIVAGRHYSVESDAQRMRKSEMGRRMREETIHDAAAVINPQRVACAAERAGGNRRWLG